MHKKIEMIIDNKKVQVDEGCVDLVTLFNHEGLKTKNSCQGDESNDFYIMFDDSVTDEMMENFISRFINKYGHSPFLGQFSKWCRIMNNQLVFNWMFTAKNLSRAEITYIRMIDILKRK